MKATTLSFYESAVTRALVRIAESLDDALDLGELARGADLSPFHFHRMFRGMVGETPLEMHRRLRLERAALQLLSSRRPVTAIAFDAGYDTHEAFTRAFRAAYGTPPLAFRQIVADHDGCVRLPQTNLASRSGIHCTPIINLQEIHFIRGASAMNVVVQEMPALRVATVSHTGAYNRISEAFQRLGSIVGPAGIMREDAMMLALYHDDPETTPVEQLRSEAGISVPEDVRLPIGVAERRLPAGRYARTTHVGPYRTLGDTWSRVLGEWLPGSGHRVIDTPCFEVYRNDPSNTPPNDLSTDLYVPIT